MSDYKQQKKAWNKGRRKAVRPFKGLAVLAIVLFIVFSVGLAIVNWFPMTFDLLTGSSRYKIENADEAAQYYESDFSSDEERVAYGQELSESVEAEGATLLVNEDDALPLAKGAKVSLVNHSSTDLVYGGTGSAGLDTSTVKNLKEAMEDVGFEVNPTLWSFYTEGAGKDYERSAASLTDTSVTYSSNEVPLDVYTDDEWISVEEYSDAAIFVVSRVGGEGADLPSETTDSQSAGYLGLDDSERAVLAHLTEMKAAGQIKKIVVLLNSSNSIQLDFLNDGAYDVDAVLWTGGMGGQGVSAVAKILAGDVNPSGRLGDTFLVDNSSSPAMVNFGSWDYTNAEEAGLDSNNENYVVYQEGIYVGYRYYETRYEDTVMATGNTSGYDYASDVAFPFGFGLSYTDFEYSDFKASYASGTDTFTIAVKVTNTGDVAGKHTVQVYAQSPYTDYDQANNVEKASAQLVGFSKTGLIEPGESQVVTIQVDGSDLASYDYTYAKTYILDPGDYLFTVAADAHAAVNNFLAAKGYSPDSTGGRMDAEGAADMVWSHTVSELDATTYAVSDITGVAITNQFDDAQINNYEGASDSGVTYLSRSDWEGTFPSEAAVLTATDEMVELLVDSRYDAGLFDDSSEYLAVTEMPTLNADNGLKAMDLYGKDYNDLLWDDLLDQMSFDDMAYLIGSAFHYTQPIESIDLTGTRDENGPTGLTTTLFGAKSDVTTMGLPSEDVMAATYNTELLQDVVASSATTASPLRWPSSTAPEPTSTARAIPGATLSTSLRTDSSRASSLPPRLLTSSPRALA